MKMKKILILIIIAVGFSSCDLDINTDPNNPSNVPNELLFPSTQNAIATVVGDGMYNYAGFFVQYYDQLPESNQYNILAEYDFQESSSILDRSYRNLYAGALADLDIIINTGASPADKYAATVLRLFSFQLLVDNMDQTPYTEALKGREQSMPKWDNGQLVYEGVLKELDNSENELDDMPMTCSDLLLNQNMTQWIGFANALRLRMYLRFVDANIDATNYISKIKSLVDAGQFFTGDIKFDVYSDETDKRNPWYSANKVNLAMNHTASYPIVTYLQSTADPRIAYIFEKAVNSGEYAGELPGSKKTLSHKKNNDYSRLKYYATKPVYFFTQSELQFLLAEVYLRFYNNEEKAKAAYEAGIDADFAAREMTESPSVLYGEDGSVNWNKSGDTDSKLELIYMQKWVALCYMDHMEAWSEVRRTDCPKLSQQTATAINEDPNIYTPGELISPMRNGFGEGNMIKRMFFPLTARQRNKNTPQAVAPTVPVWWDIK